MSKQYKQRTKLLGIPVLDFGDRIWPDVELRKYQIIENMLMGAMRGAVNCVFDEGSATVAKQENGTWKATLSATGSSNSLTGTVGGAYFKAPATLVWEGMEEGRTYFLYVRGSPKTFVDPSEIRAIVTPTRLSDSVSVLVAKVSTSGEKASLDMNPAGKVNARDLARHVTDWDNPHGEAVAQDEMLVRSKLAFEESAVMEIGAGREFPMKDVADLLAANQTRKIVDFVSAGPGGVVLDGGGRVAFAAVSRRFAASADGLEWANKTGEVAVGYNGEDPAAKRPDQFVVRNSGDTGIPMRALVVCG